MINKGSNMQHLVSFIVRLLVVSLSLVTTLSAQAANNANVLVIGNDANAGSISRDNPAFISIIGALANNMHENNFDVYDETAITLDGFEQNRLHRSDAEIIDIARSIKRPPIDIAVIFSMYVNRQENGYSTKVSARIEGRLLNVQTGRRLGNFEIDSGRPWNVPSQCDIDCILINSNDKALLMANDLGAALAEKLAWLTDGGNSHLGLDRPGTNHLNTSYSLIFDGFSGESFAEIEEYLVAFSGYDSYRPVEIRYTRTEIWYKSSIDTAKLNRNLRKMIAEMNLTAIINFSGNTFTVKKMTLRGKINNLNSE